MMPLRWKLVLLIFLVPVLEKTEAKRCSNIPPFLDRLRFGVDITKLDLLPLDQNGNDGFKNLIFDFTCDEGKTKVINKITYEIPDQIWYISPISSGWLNSLIKIYKTSHNIKSSMAVNSNLKLANGIFSGSGSYEKMQEYLTNSSKFIEETTSYVSEYKVILNPYYVLQPGKFSQILIDNLPIALNADSLENYFRFIDQFGTHYFKLGTFGGIIRLVLVTDQSYYLGKTDEAVKVQAQAVFAKYLNIGGGLSSSSQGIDSKFNQVTRQIIRYYGGKANLLMKGGTAAWQPTVADNPYLLNGNLREISRIITNDTKRQAMKKAVEIYTDKAYLQELIRVVQWWYASGKWNDQRGIIEDYLSQIKTLNSQKMPDHSAVTRLGTKIDEATTVPAWFRQVKLCYNWYAEEDAGQCSQVTAVAKCAKVNSFTDYYRDDTDRRGGGCKMQWKIESSGHEDWFTKVQLCFRWWADGNSDQCGGGVNNLLCENINTYTPFYRDDTDRRYGACNMQWKLSVPSEAPLWMHTVEICLDWYADGDSGQCGGGVPRTICAKANSFTRAYRDDSDRRYGGCQMRWGIRVH